LLVRLVEEAAAETSKKGYCDTEMSKVKHSERSQFEKVQSLSAALEELESIRDALSISINQTTQAVKNNQKTATEAAEDRESVHKENMQAMLTAKKGATAIAEALTVLNKYYHDAAKGAALLQASPLDAELGNKAPTGSYGGQQSGMKNVVGLLETIKTDFQRTLRNTDQSEKAAQREYVKTSTALAADTKAKETAITMDQEAFSTAELDIKRSFSELKTNQDLLDQALKQHELLKPTCVDTAMSHAQRDAKRQGEISALKTALCQLDTEKVEDDCK